MRKLSHREVQLPLMIQSWKVIESQIQTQVCQAPNLTLFPPLHSSSLQWEYTVLAGLPLVANDRSSPWREEEEECLCPAPSQPLFPAGQCAQLGAKSSSLQNCNPTSCQRPPTMSAPTPHWKVSLPSLENVRRARNSGHVAGRGPHSWDLKVICHRWRTTWAHVRHSSRSLRRTFGKSHKICVSSTV